MYWPNQYFWTSDQEDVTTLRAAGLNSQEIARLRQLRQAHRRCPDKQDQNQPSPDLMRLLFIRWLVLHGKLSNYSEDTRCPMPAGRSGRSLSAFPFACPGGQKPSWLRRTLRALRLVFARCVK